jgi:prepilin-type N-terminal cleavage/methylation domain-containing protein
MMCKTCPRNDRKKSAVIVRLGMTVVELMMVLAILGILTSIAVSAYSSYRVSEYDNEAIATLNDLYAQATQSIAEWGVGEGGIQRDCYTVVCNTSAWRNASHCGGRFLKGTSFTNVSLPTELHHWTYQLCFGFIDATNQVEGFLISAHRISGNNEAERVIVFGTGIEVPIIEADTNGMSSENILPQGAILEDNLWDPDAL